MVRCNRLWSLTNLGAAKATQVGNADRKLVVIRALSRRHWIGELVMLLQVNDAPVVGISTTDAASIKPLKSAIAVTFLSGDPCFSVSNRMQLNRQR